MADLCILGDYICVAVQTTSRPPHADRCDQIPLRQLERIRQRKSDPLAPRADTLDERLTLAAPKDGETDENTNGDTSAGANGTARGAEEEICLRRGRGGREPPPLEHRPCVSQWLADEANNSRLLLYLIQVEVAPVGGLVLLVDSGEGLLEGVLGGGVEHLWLHARVVVAPRNKDELVGSGTRFGFDLDVEDRVAAIIVWEV